MKNCNILTYILFSKTCLLTVPTCDFGIKIENYVKLYISDRTRYRVRISIIKCTTFHTDSYIIWPLHWIIYIDMYFCQPKYSNGYEYSSNKIKFN
jgi:hypothetical protein